MVGQGPDITRLPEMPDLTGNSADEHGKILKGRTIVIYFMANYSQAFQILKEKRTMR